MLNKFSDCSYCVGLVDDMIAIDFFKENMFAG